MFFGDSDGSIAEQGGAVDPLKHWTLQRENKTYVVRFIIWRTLAQAAGGTGMVGCPRPLPNEGIELRGYTVPV